MSRRCDFILLVCPLGCGERVRSSAMEEHIRSYCSKRSYVCEHCGYYNKRDIVTEKHYPICELFPVECPNKCSLENLKRMQFEMHLEEQCPLQVIQCPFTSAGCTVQLPRREMEEHEDKAVRQHLRMVMMTSLHSKPAAIPSQYLFSLTPMEFTITDFLKMKESNTEWVSPPFYTHPQGYKLCLVVYPNGIGYGKGSHMSIFVALLKGEHDDKLGWPLELDVAIELLNWKEDKGHHEQTVTMNSEYYQVTKNYIKMSPSCLQFIHHSRLLYNSIDTEYLQDNSLQLRVNSAATIYSRTTSLVVPSPSWQDPSNVSQPVCEFTLTEFTKRKQPNNQLFSPPFYTHQHGYKLCLKILANGNSSGKGTHVAVYIQLMAGDNDDQLHWPFDGDVVIEILNWREDKEHHNVTLSSFDFSEVTSGTVGKTMGNEKFISHSLLSCDPTSNTEYLHNDSLRLRVKQVAVYFAPLTLKIPFWQDPSNDSVCECTLTEFTKRKQSNNTFYSSPFHTYQHGYKICLTVYANGSSKGKGTHISVYVLLLASDNDDQLQWPFVGVVNVMLLNWREDKGHHKKTYSITKNHDLVRVVEGYIGKKHGYSQFISHSSLFYNSSTNTEYLQDDCLRFRVNMVTK